jgi:hypothetical protein
MKYAMRRYFMATHAWVVKGFEEHADATSDSNSEQSILQSKVPDFVRSALEQRFQHEGFALDDMVSMIAVVESLVFNEGVRGVALSFEVNSLDAGSILSQRQLQDVMDSYFMIEMLEGSPDIKAHTADKNKVNELYPNWDEARIFMTDIAASDGFNRNSVSNPFAVNIYMFEDLVRLAGRISEEFGPWSSYECHNMKELLTEKDVHGTGRVKLSDFYKASQDGAWQFLEPSEYLWQLGALDESSSYLGPQVMIANYITGNSNCISSAPFFSVCCLNECDLIYEQIESEISAPNGTVDQILDAVEMLPSFTEVSEKMIRRLEEISTIDGGSIPLHGRLFAQWLHFMFPRDCPYPHETGSITPKQWREQVGHELSAVTEDEVKQHLEAAHASRDPSPDAGDNMWDFQETLMDFHTPSDSQEEMWSSFLCFCCQLMIVGTFGSVLVREGIRTLSASKSNPKEYKI